MAGGRFGFLEGSIGPVIHAGSFFREHNGIPFSPGAKDDYLKPGLAAASSVTIAKILYFGVEWQGFKTKEAVFAPDGTLLKVRPIWAKSWTLRMGFWF